MQAFLSEFESRTSPHGRHRKYGEDLLIKYRIVEPNTLRVQNLISFKPHNMVSFGRMLCGLADKHGVIISGKVMPTLVGPSVTKKEQYFLGLDQNRLLKLYKAFGFSATEDSNGIQVIRSPR